MTLDAFEVTDNVIIIGNHDRIKALPDLPDIVPDALQIFSPEDCLLMALFHTESITVNAGYIERKVKCLT